MGQLQHRPTGRRICLRAEHLIGRGSGADLVLEDPVTSSLHAALRWVSQRWQVRDLGSRNGVFVNGHRIEAPVSLQEGAVIGFGSPAGPWVLADASPPRAFARRLSDGLEIEGTSGTLGLPDAEAEAMSIHRGARGWVAEIGAELQPVQDREIVDAGDRFRLHLPAPAAPETTEAHATRVHLEEVELHFRVSQDQEHIEIDVAHRAGTERIGHYAANELLWVLAQLRIRDRDVPEPEERGWVPFDDVYPMFRLTAMSPRDQNRLRQWIHQCRRRFERLGIVEGERIIERRAGSRQVRLGVARVTIGGA